MKIYIVTDMEGVCGVMDHDDWVMPQGSYYDAGKKLLTLEVNAAVEGFYKAGADEIYVLDGHGAGGINQELLDSRTRLIRATGTPWPFALDNTFDAIAWVGQHAKAGTPYAHIAHTGWFSVFDFKINDISVGEFGQFAMCAAYMGVHSIFASGDKAFTKEAANLVEGIETVQVKEGLVSDSGEDCDCDTYRNHNIAAIHIHPEQARKLIRDGAEIALDRYIKQKQSFKLLDLKPPFTREVSYRDDGDIHSYKTYSEHKDDLIKMFNLPEIKVV